jgi:uncharacterized protein (DUF1778 family)
MGNKPIDAKLDRPLHVLLAQEDYDLLERAAKQQGRSVSNLARMILRDQLHQDAGQ